MAEERIYTTASVHSKDATEIGYRQLGQGPGLVLLHGGMQSSQNFMELARQLRDTFTVYIPDRRGRGMSGSYGDGYSIARECEDLQAVIEKTVARNVFALSSGALIALSTALRFQSIHKLAVYEPPLSINHSSPTDWIVRFDRELARGELASALVTVLKGLQASLTMQVMPRIVLTPLISLAIAADAKNVKRGDVSIKTLIPTMHFDVQLVMETEGALDRLREVRAEVLLLGGSKSQKFLRLALDALASTLPHVNRVEFAGLDHMAADNRGKPKIVGEQLKRFFS